MNPLADIAVLGLGTMGAALAQNFASRGHNTAVYNRSAEKTDAFFAALEHPEQFVRADDIQILVAGLHRPRKLMLMVSAGAAVDAVIEELLPHLEEGDIIIDGGNSFYKDTQRREAALKEKGIHFVGCGVSGGEEGARLGPSIMPGGSAESWAALAPLLESVAAKDFSGGPCVTHVGENGAGHYVKMVHNGIEYGIMQLIAETYDVLQHGYKMPAAEIADVFEAWNEGKLGSYLVEITVPVLRKKDDQTGKNTPLVEAILDKASNKGTGKWTSLDALERGEAIPTITAAVYARYMSTQKELRQELRNLYGEKSVASVLPKEEMLRILEDALYAAIISSYAQGYALIHRAAKEENWNISSAEVSRIWEGGCIIRAKLLKTFHEAYAEDGANEMHLFALPAVRELMVSSTPALVSFVKEATTIGTPLPAFTASLAYIQSMTSAQLPANLLQGLRDYFGAHTYERIDQEGSFHSNWNA